MQFIESDGASAEACIRRAAERTGLPIAERDFERIAAMTQALWTSGARNRQAFDSDVAVPPATTMPDHDAFGKRP